MLLAVVLGGAMSAGTWREAHALTNCDTATMAHDSSEMQVINLINQYRASKNLPALTPSTGGLARAAAWFGEDANSTRVLSHTDSLGRSANARLADCGYPRTAWFAEVMGLGGFTPQSIVEGWKNSPGHNAAILSASATHIGVGHTGAAWVADLGSFDPGGSTSPPPATATPTAPSVGYTPPATVPAGGNPSPSPTPVRTVIPSTPIPSHQLPTNFPIRRASLQMIASD